MKAKSSGTIPSPFTLASVLPSNGKYELAATNSSTFVVKKLPDKLELHTQVVSIPRSFTRVLDEHDGVSAISRNNPRV
jgi:hypothetical protein